MNEVINYNVIISKCMQLDFHFQIVDLSVILLWCGVLSYDIAKRS